MIHDLKRIVFFGTPQFAVIILQKLIDTHIPPVAVVTAPDKPAGRGHRLTSPPVKILADTYRISVVQPEKLDTGFIFQISGFKPDVFIIAAYGKIIPKSMLDIPPKGTINVHPSLLPRHRGPAPIQGAILGGDESTGVTLMLTDEKMDHGPIIKSAIYNMQNAKILYTELHDILARMGGDLLVETLPLWIAGKITPKEQEHEKATYTKLLKKEDGHIDWSKSAIEIDRMVRALNPWPGTWNYITFGDPISDSEIGSPKVSNRVKILSGHPTNKLSPSKPGTLIKQKNGELAVCTEDYLYVVENLQPEGKKEVSGQIFVNSVPDALYF